MLAHSLKTAHICEELASVVGLREAGFYAGLLHDVGKLNPYYQILFFTEPWKRHDVKQQLDKDYIRAHALFSALAAYSLTNTAALPKSTRKQVLFAVAGHHSKLTQFNKSLPYINRVEKRFNKSYGDLYNNLVRFSTSARELEEFKGLAWDSCLDRFQIQTIPRNEPDYKSDGDFIGDFLAFSSVFSALIQADRGSFFSDWQPPAFDIDLDTGVLVRMGFPLSEIRESFQEKVLLENLFDDSLLILKAPTGIGKTKIFLDIVNKVSRTQHFERVFYFSPLLALTDDFERKLFDVKRTNSVISGKDAEKVLVYNHAFVGSLLKKRLNEDEDGLDDPEFLKSKEHFDRESFNKELIVTTTQRLLMVLYSNEPSDKQKLLSFKNSFLIIDEVQTIPKLLLPNLTALLKALTLKYHSKILLVSATIPDELLGFPQLKTPKELEERYLKMTGKRIEYMPILDTEREISRLRDDDRSLFMFNTRRKALCFFAKASVLKPNAIYLSSGIRKRDRINLITSLHGSTAATVVSTQVLEAGVDISFSRMYRELAPLDNIVQAMGRLNREGEAHSEPVLTVFLDDGDYKPYSELEVEESKSLIPTVHSSLELYAALPGYYKKVSSENLRNKNLAKQLECSMRDLNFDDVWTFIRKYSLPLELSDSLLVPDYREWDEVKNHFLNPNLSKDRGKVYKRYAKLMAQLPRAIEEIDGIERLLDEELLKMGVLLPKKDTLNEVYDAKVGLDKWVKGV